MKRSRGIEGKGTRTRIDDDLMKREVEKILGLKERDFRGKMT